MKTGDPDCKENEVSVYIDDGRGMRWKFVHRRSTSADARNLYILLADEHERQEAATTARDEQSARSHRMKNTKINTLERQVFAYKGVVGRQRKEIKQLRAVLEGQSS
jgi:hypothetical protein